MFPVYEIANGIITFTGEVLSEVDKIISDDSIKSKMNPFTIRKNVA